MVTQHRPWVVLKFGGTSVANKDRWLNILKLAKQSLNQGCRPLLVCSAISGVSNLLDELVLLASKGGSSYEEPLHKIQQKHSYLAEEFNLDGHLKCIEGLLDELGRYAMGLSLLKQWDEKTKAKMMAIGELMLTKMAKEWLSKQLVESTVSWVDARELLVVMESESYLNGVCRFEEDPIVQQKLMAQEGDIIVTQGFIAHNPYGETVLLGRGGSDTSASYLAAKLKANRLEIWTDVPGMFTSNPREIPSAKLLLHLNYDEAQELATSGAKVLHPRCIGPMKQHGIPIYLGQTSNPELPRTLISQTPKGVKEKRSSMAQVKAVMSKNGIQVFTMETIGMWQEVGFLAEIFTCFKTHKVSIDLVATSQSNVTVTLDPNGGILSERKLKVLLADLEKFCCPKYLGRCSVVSLVGKNIRSIIHQLGPSLEAFEEQKIYLISQAASDLNFTFTIDESQASKVLSRLHAHFFSDVVQDEVFGPSWDQLLQANTQNIQQVSIIEASTSEWWKNKKDLLLKLASQHDGALYIYDRATIVNSVDQLRKIKQIKKFHYAIKANANPEILRTLYKEGISFDCVSWNEVEHVFNHVEKTCGKDILFTPNFAPIEEYKKAFHAGCYVTLDNLHPLVHHPDVFQGQEILVRLDPGVGKGHHKYVRTAGVQSKFGVSMEEMDRLYELTQKYQVKVIGLHAHVGSGIKMAQTWSEVAIFLLGQASRFKDVRILDLGGGLGVSERPGQKNVDTLQINDYLEKFIMAYPQFELWMEPGRFIVSQAGVLLTQVTQLKKKGSKDYIGVNVGMNALIRPALYGAYHHIVNLNRPSEPQTVKADIVGPICETGDVLGHGRSLPPTFEGDTLLIENAGAYAREMASSYNKRNPPEEILI